MSKDIRTKLIDSLAAPPADTPLPCEIDKTGLEYYCGCSEFTCLYVDHILTLEECKLFIEWSESLGYEQARVHNGEGDAGAVLTDYRKSQRAMTDDHEIADLLFARVRPFLPITINESNTIFRMNERLRFLKYENGDFFKPHFDGSHQSDGRTETAITVQFYFNNPIGGATSFLGQRVEKVKAVAGRALIFEHDILHQGDVVEDLKYALRTDILYRDQKA